MFLGACDALGVQPARPIELAGEWVMIGGGLEYPIACGSHGPIIFESDGKYFIWGESGIWRLEGDVLTVTMTGFDPLHVDFSPEDIGKTYESTIRWVDQDTFLKRTTDGSTWAFRRCPERK